MIHKVVAGWSIRENADEKDFKIQNWNCKQSLNLILKFSTWLLFSGSVLNLQSKAKVQLAIEAIKNPIKS